ncbi:Nucleotidyltransferase domain-containing protein [Desulfonema limicola]|uniref:Nucleotidyltransferase domain-containing protein n=1 Tax=Desulfonema limicola TaxID=45656 RepID=A0A975BCY0_9BACT|nr:nucleotidyltransferase family protein [Desulfonema limicola]QTA83072.1 Nucleotidyltransferase domain-containing protein [Desulfonema limicola]
MINYQLPEKQIAEFCKKNHIRKLSVFGSVLKNNFKPESDIDLLVEFYPEHIPGLIRLSGMETELSKILGRKADIQTLEDISFYFRHDVFNSAKVHYAEG